MFYDKINDKSNFRLTINPTLKCNFNCWYCYENHTGNSRMSEDILERTKKAISWVLTEYPFLDLMFFGGEPLLEFERIVKPIMEYTRKAATEKAKGYSISFTTNGFLITRKMAEYFREFNIGSLQITLDGDRESHNKTRVGTTKESFLTIVKNIHMLVSMGINVFLRINVTKDNIKGCLDIHNYFADLSEETKRFMQVTVQQVWQDKEKNNDLSAEFFELYKSFAKIGITIMPNFSSRFKSPCYGDKLHTCVINYNGNIYKCTAIDFDRHISEGRIGDSGKITIDNLQQEKRVRIWETKCKTCRILPMCCGGCTKLLQNSGGMEICPYPTDDEKDRFIIRTVKEQLFMEKIGNMLNTLA